MARSRNAVVRWTVIWLAVAAGAGMLWWSWALIPDGAGQAAGWLQGVLVNLGAAILLVVPIELVSAALTRRVDQVEATTTAAVGQAREDVAEVRRETVESVAGLRRDVEGVRQDVASLQEFGEAFRERLAAERAEETALYRRVGLDGNPPDRGVLVDALQRAQENGVVSPRYGPRAEPHQGDGNYLAPAYEPNDFGEPDLCFRLTNVHGFQRASVPWEPDQSAGDVMIEVARMLRANGVDGAFDVAAWFRRISETLVVGASHTERRAIIELSPPQWAITEEGLAPYPDRAGRGIGAGTIRRPEGVLAVKAWPWVDFDSFDHAVYVWKMIFGGRDPWDALPGSGEPPF